MMTDHTSSGSGSRHPRLSEWRREALRTTLWVVPAAMVAVAAIVFWVTYSLDAAVHEGRITLPGWAIRGGADATRAVLIGIAAAVITVAGVVFSITILALQLASQQFGPRMLRNFIRDLGTQVSLGAFVSTFVYSILTLGSVAHGSPGFVPHVSVTVALVFMLGDLAVLIYFIHHVATSIQLTSVVAGIARDFRSTLATLRREAGKATSLPADAEEVRDVRTRLERDGAPVAARRSGFLQAVGHARLIRIATSSDTVIQLLHRPGQFVVEGQPLALVSPGEASGAVSDALDDAHLVGPNRTLAQDPGFAIDQLVEVAIRALSPAVNDTFTALNCIDWLGDCLCRAARPPLPGGIFRDDVGAVRVLDPAIAFEHLLKQSSDKIRQAGRGMPAILIRQLENLMKVAAVSDPSQREPIVRHAEMLWRAADESVPELSDRGDVRAAFDQFMLVGPGSVETTSADAHP